MLLMISLLKMLGAIILYGDRYGYSFLLRLRKQWNSTADRFSINVSGNMEIATVSCTLQITWYVFFMAREIQRDHKTWPVCETLREKCRIRYYSGLHFPAFRLKTERYGVSLRIQSECGKIRTRITPNTDTSRSFSGAVFFLAVELNMEAHRLHLRIHSECGEIRVRTNPECRHFTQLASEYCYIILIPLYCKFTVIIWLNDCEDMKLVVQTHVVLFH